MVLCELKDFLGVIGTLGGAVVGGGIVWFVSRSQLKHQRDLEREKRQVANFESIHEHLSTVSNRSGVLSVAVIAQAAMGRQIKKDDVGEVPIDKLRMLVDFYAPTLKADVDQIPEQLMELTRALGAAVIAEQPTEDQKARSVIAAKDASRRISEAANSAKQKLTELVKPFTSAPPASVWRRALAWILRTIKRRTA